MKLEVEVTRFNPGNVELRCKNPADADMLELFLSLRHGHRVTRTPTDQRVVFLHDPGRDFTPASELASAPERTKPPQRTLEEAVT